jgi:hypothetical protein
VTLRRDILATKAAAILGSVISEDWGIDNWNEFPLDCQVIVCFTLPESAADLVRGEHFCASDKKLRPLLPANLNGNVKGIIGLHPKCNLQSTACQKALLSHVRGLND